MFGVIPKLLWSRVYHADENNLILLSLRSLIIETGGRIILIDTGWGDKQDEKFFRHLCLHGGEGLSGGLRNSGFSPEDITDVFITHLHADHCGGGIKRQNNGNGYGLTFPNATYHISRLQWEWAVRNNVREEDSFLSENILPIGESGHLSLVDKDCMLFPDFEVRICNGHTPGLMIPIIKYKDRTIVFAGDLIPTKAHIPLVWNMSYDIEPLKTIDEKERFLREALEGNWILLFQHDEKIECSNLKMTREGIRSKESFTLNSIL
jgi:glyoxylase-like metal-dependent hydrolase (beta-lactamase superfamily II)